MYQKIIIILLSLALVLSFAGCASVSSDPDDTAANPTTGITGTTGTLGAEPSNPAQTTPDVNTPPVIDFTETVLVDNDQFLIKATDIKINDSGDYVVFFSVDNHTAFKIDFNLYYVSVNGLMDNNIAECSVAPKESSKAYLVFTKDELDAMPFTNITQIEFTLRIFDTDEWDILWDKIYTIYPAGQENATIFQRESEDTDIIVLDNEYATVTITDLQFDSEQNYNMTIFTVNKTDKKIMFSLDDVSVNGVMCDPMWASEIAPGKMSLDTGVFKQEELAKIGIEDVTQIEFRLQAEDTAIWDGNCMIDEACTLYPAGKENATVQLRQPQSTDIVLVDNEFATVIVTGYDPNGKWGYNMNVYLVNKTDKELAFGVSNEAINGKEIKTYWTAQLPAGKVCYSEVVWETFELQDKGISKVEKIDITFCAHHTDNWFADYLFEEADTLNP